MNSEGMLPGKMGQDGILYCKDIQILIRKDKRPALRLMNKIRQKYKKLPHQFITIGDFCGYTGLTIEMVRGILKW